MFFELFNKVQYIHFNVNEMIINQLLNDLFPKMSIKKKNSKVFKYRMLNQK